MKNFLITFSLLLLSLSLCAQADYTWWNQVHNWDGKSPWRNYLTLSPAFMGPNALPVPALRSSRTAAEIELDNRLEWYGGNGDRTSDWKLRLLLPVAKNKVALEGMVVPLEYYLLDDETRNKRAARDFDATGIAGGDIYVSTLVQALNENKHFINLLFESTLRTASGTGLRNARYTDTPGYYFALFTGKTFNLLPNVADSIEIVVMTGFYSWQTYSAANPQNDALLYGLGIKFRIKAFRFEMDASGYSGYLNNGDQPIIVRAKSGYNRRNSHYYLSFSTGMHDFHYRNIGIGWQQKIVLKNKSRN